MADITITVPNPQVPILAAVATRYLLAQATTPAEIAAVNAMSTAAKGKAYIAAILRDIVVKERADVVAAGAAQALIDAEKAAATTEASGIV